MNMSRKHKVSDNRIIEYFELKYETNVEFGLTSAQVRSRLHKNNAYNVAKEKKQIWLICFKQECRDLLFFIYLCGISWIFDFSERIQITLALIFFFLFILKIKRAFRIKKAFFEQKEINSSKVIVLRDGIFHRMPWQYLLRGTTLKRVWGYISDKGDKYKPTRYTVCALAKLLGFNDYESFIVCPNPETVQPNLFAESIDISTLLAGDVLSITWSRDSRCRLKYIGEDLFDVIETRNAKMTKIQTIIKQIKQIKQMKF